MKIEWRGYCIECCKWRHSHHIVESRSTGEMRCGICITRLLMTCPVCKGDGGEKTAEFTGSHLTDDGEYIRACPHCGGHRVIPQEEVSMRRGNEESV